MKNDTKSAKKVMNFPPKTNQGACVKVLTVVLSLDWWATLRGWWLSIPVKKRKESSCKDQRWPQGGDICECKSSHTHITHPSIHSEQSKHKRLTPSLEAVQMTDRWNIILVTLTAFQLTRHANLQHAATSSKHTQEDIKPSERNKQEWLQTRTLKTNHSLKWHQWAKINMTMRPSRSKILHFWQG